MATVYDCLDSVLWHSILARNERDSSMRSRLGGMTLAQNADRITVAWLTGIARRHAMLMLSNTSTDMGAAVTELRYTANGRTDLLARVAATATSAGDATIPYYAELGQVMARLCELAEAADVPHTGPTAED